MSNLDFSGLFSYGLVAVGTSVVGVTVRITVSVVVGRSRGRRAVVTIVIVNAPSELGIGWFQA